MKKQPTKKELETEVQKLKDQLTGPYAPEYYLVTLADRLKVEVETDKKNILGWCAGAGWNHDPRTRATILVSSLEAQLLLKIQLSSLLESSREVEEARRVIYPLQAKLREAEERLAKHVAEIGDTRRKLEEELTARIEAAKQSPEIRALEERLEALQA